MEETGRWFSGRLWFSAAATMRHCFVVLPLFDVTVAESRDGPHVLWLWDYVWTAVD